MTSSVKPKMTRLLVLAVCQLAWGTLANCGIGEVAPNLPGPVVIPAGVGGGGPGATLQPWDLPPPTVASILDAQEWPPWYPVTTISPDFDGSDEATNVFPDPVNSPLGASTFEDCADLYPVLYWTNSVQDGVYPIKPRSSTDHFDVYCDMTTDGGGWTVIQKRSDGRYNFDRFWADYKNGFGRVEGEHWLGLDKIHNLTSQNSYELYVELGDWEDNFAHAKYSTFSIGDESTDYTLHIGGYSGPEDAGDSLAYHNGMKFSARDKDNDVSSPIHCAQFHSGGWWYNMCAVSALNSPYYQSEEYHGPDTGPGIYWYHWKGEFYSLKATKMMVRPRNFVRNLSLNL